MAIKQPQVNGHINVLQAINIYEGNPDEQGDYVRMDCDDKNTQIKTEKGMSGNIKLGSLKVGFYGGRFSEVQDRVVQKAFV